ncbi:MAG: hypothetical protein II487_00570 [Schwartzia sp.]|nr:hypothetical protein [Schwartzia sp. (in: firmicutes)]
MLCQLTLDVAHNYSGASASVPNEKILRHHCRAFPSCFVSRCLTKHIPTPAHQFPCQTKKFFGIIAAHSHNALSADA